MEVQVARTVAELLSLSLRNDHVEDTTCCILDIVGHDTSLLDVPHLEAFRCSSKKKILAIEACTDDRH